MKNTETASPTRELLTCYHCGENCTNEKFETDNHFFCCPGCKLVYEVLRENSLCNYYDIQQQPGQTIRNLHLGNRFDYLDDPLITEKLQVYRDKQIVHLQFHIPAMHCSSCIWLLENLSRITPGILSSQVDFIQKQFRVVYDKDVTTLRKIVETLTLIGYEPELNLQQLGQQPVKKKSRLRIFRIGVAGFAFGNIMLLSFPGYLSSDKFTGIQFGETFAYLNLLLSIPVFFFSAWEFIGSALKSFRQKTVNIDVPLALGIVAIFLRSVYEVLSQTGQGYFDSMTGLVFFMLIGRNFQDKTFNWLSFERDYRSYLPIAVTRLTGTGKSSVAVNELKVNDRILLRNQDIFPTDVTLLDESAEVDYSFITGESRPVGCVRGERIFAGARLVGAPAEALVQKEVSQSYITGLWNQSPSGKSFVSGFSKMTTIISKWFILLTVIIAVSGWIYWYPSDTEKAVNVFTAVLVIACACALALSAPFTFGNMLRILGRNGIYLRNAAVIEKLADIQVIVFDKTGTLTDSGIVSLAWTGSALSAAELTAIKSVAAASNHPLSRQLESGIANEVQEIKDVTEIPGHGISGSCNQLQVNIGRADFCFASSTPSVNGSVVHIGINGKYVGYFQIKNQYRKGLTEMFLSLRRKNTRLAILSGDNDNEKETLSGLSGLNDSLLFNQRPEDKLDYIKKLQESSGGVMMVGDGLNDAAALKQSDVGLAVSADVNNFSPACDGILSASKLVKLESLLRFSRAGIRIIIASFIISLLYNAVGLYFAVTGQLSPMIAAILMPVSTSSLVLFTVLCSTYMARKLGLNSAS